jgi:membrane protease YdiL (CAAX protease family)
MSQSDAPPTTAGAPPAPAATATTEHRAGGRNVDAPPLPPPELPQYSRAQIVAVWAAVTVPMALLGWVVAPWLSRQLITRDPFIDALLICFNVGLLWMLALVLTLLHRERGGLSWSDVRDGLWLRSPRDPKTGRVGGRLWWWALPFTVLSFAVNLLPIDPSGPPPRDLPEAILTARVAHYFSGNWYGFALLMANVVLAPVVEELVFRGLLLPRMRTACGRADVVVNGTLFTLYHLHQPWSMPATLLDGIVNQAYPTRRFRSAWIGIITHTSLSLLVVGVVLKLVLS